MNVIAIVGWSGSGKTTLTEGVIQNLSASGLRIATIKHAHRRFDMDREGKDSYRHRAAGARQVMVVSPNRWALLTEHDPVDEAPLAEALARLDPCDIVLVEGYRGADIPKIEVWRQGRGGDALWPDDPNIVAVATDAEAADLPAPLNGTPRFPLDDAGGLAAFIRARFATSAAAFVEETPP